VSARARWLALGFVLALALVDTAGFLAMHRAGLAARWMGVEDLASDARDADWDLERGVRELDLADVLEMMRDVMDEVPRVGAGPGAMDADVIRTHVAEGGGLECGDMACLLADSVVNEGGRVRLVTLMRNPGDPWDVHVVAEAEVDGRWVVFDPTFNVTYEIGGRPVGALEVSETLMGRERARVDAVFHGEVAYPVRLGDYYIDWRPLFDNVFVWSPGTSAKWAAVPPVRWWTGPVLYYQSDSVVSVAHLGVLDNLYAVIVLLIPIVLVVLVVVLSAAAWFLRRTS